MSDFSAYRTIKARKQHRCQECSRPIDAGESYQRYAGVWEGDFYTFVSCAHCAALRTRIGRTDPDFWEGGLGGISDWFHQGMIRETIRTFADGLQLTRLRRQFSRRWRNQDGTLMDVPEGTR